MTTRKKWALSIGTVVLLGLGGFVLYVLTQCGLAIPQETLDALRPGMTFDKVQAIIGVPPGDYTTRQLNVKLRPAQSHEKRWYTNGGVHEILFDLDGKMFQRVHFAEPNEHWMNRVRRWLRF